jgi:F-type H+-transporting ATPase subunit g
MSTFQSYFQRLVKSVRNPGSLMSQASQTAQSANPTPESILNSVRNINSAQLASYGVILAEVLGFFTVGEMIGRMKLVGYRGETNVHH